MAKTASATVVKKMIEEVKIITRSYYLFVAISIFVGLLSLWFDSSCLANTDLASEIFCYYTVIYIFVKSFDIGAEALEKVLEAAYNKTAPNRPTLVVIPYDFKFGFLVFALCFASITGSVVYLQAVMKMVQLRIWTIKGFTGLILLENLFIILNYFFRSARLSWSLVKIIMG